MSKPTAAGGNSGGGGGNGVGPSRRTWDKDDFARKAMSREKRQAELEAVNAERRSQGLPPLKRLKSNAPEPELAMQQRRAPLDLDRNQGKTLMVDLATDGGKGQTGPGFYCETCRKLLKDNLAYLDHINGRVHLMRIGQSTQQDRASLDQVKQMLDELRRKLELSGGGGGGQATASAVYDFDQRIRQIAEQEERARQEKRDKRRQRKQQSKPSTSISTTTTTDADPTKTATAAAAAAGQEGANDAETAMMAAMGFDGFGSTKKR